MKKKKYILPEDETPVLNEPTAIYSSTDQVKKAKSSASTAPCQYSMEELKDGISEFIEEFENDDLIPHEEIKRKKL